MIIYGFALTIEAEILFADFSSAKRLQRKAWPERKRPPKRRAGPKNLKVSGLRFF